MKIFLLFLISSTFGFHPVQRGNGNQVGGIHLLWSNLLKNMDQQPPRLDSRYSSGKFAALPKTNSINIIQAGGQKYQTKPLLTACPSLTPAVTETKILFVTETVECPSAKFKTDTRTLFQPSKPLAIEETESPEKLFWTILNPANFKSTPLDGHS